MKKETDLEFLNNFWKKSQEIGIKIKKELPDMSRPQESIKESGNMYIVNFSDLRDNWGVKEVLSKTAGISQTLEIFANKLNHMIILGRASHIEPMIKSILKGKIKVWRDGYKNKGSRNKRREKKKNYDIIEFHIIDENKNYYGGEEQDFIYGHFRWDFKGHILTQEEILHIKRYFKI